MSDSGEPIGREAGDLLLQVLEMPEPMVTAAAIETLGVQRAAPLVKAGLLKPAGHERVIASFSDHDDALTEGGSGSPGLHRAFGAKVFDRNPRRTRWLSGIEPDRTGHTLEHLAPHIGAVALDR
jgi:hypothetical protein